MNLITEWKFIQADLKDARSCIRQWSKSANYWRMAIREDLRLGTYLSSKVSLPDALETATGALADNKARITRLRDQLIELETQK